MPETVDPTTTAFAAFLSDPRFPSDGTIPSQMGDDSAARRRDLGRRRRRQVGGPRQRRHLLRPAEHAQPGRQRHDQRPAAADHLRQHRQRPAVRRRRADVARRGHADAAPRRARSRCSRACACSTATTRTRASIRSPSATSRSSSPNVSGYADYTHARGRNLTRFLNYNLASGAASHRQHLYLPGRRRSAPQLDEVMVTTSLGTVRLQRADAGHPQALLGPFQLEANYVLSRDKDDDSNERDPFIDRSFNFFDLSLDYALLGPRHPAQGQRLRLFRVPAAFKFDARMQGRTAPSRSRRARAS